MREFIAWLARWQELIGAIAGGLLGVTGALIVARELTSRERRSASRMLQRDLFSVKVMVDTLTHGRRAPLSAIGNPLIEKLAFNRHHLSVLFEAQMSIIFASDRALAGLLVGFHQQYSTIDLYMGRIERAFSEPNVPAVDREREQLPAVLRGADECARAALYLLELQEMGIGRRIFERTRRRFFATLEDKEAQALIGRIMNPGAGTADRTSTP